MRIRRIHEEKLSLRKITSQRDYCVHKAAIRVCKRRVSTQTDTKEYIHLFKTIPTNQGYTTN